MRGSISMAPTGLGGDGRSRKIRRHGTRRLDFSRPAQVAVPAAGLWLPALSLARGRSTDLFTQRRLRTFSQRRSGGRIRIFRRIAGVVAQIPRAEAVAVAALSRLRRISRSRSPKIWRMPAAWRRRFRNESQLELLASGRTERGLLPSSGRRHPSEEELNHLNLALLKRIVERGRVYLSNASLRGKFCLRACIVNHRTTDADVDSVVPEVLAPAKELGRALDFTRPLVQCRHLFQADRCPSAAGPATNRRP